MWLLLLLGVLAVPGEQGGGATSVAITSPPADVAAFGTVEVAARIDGPVQPVVVRFLVDGRLVGEIRTPPYRTQIDLGPDNVAHVFKVVVALPSGQTVMAERRTPEVKVDDTMEVELRQVYVLASAAGEHILDLESDDFLLREDGLAQQLVTFARGDAPLAAAVLVDASLSMKGARLRGATAGARAFFGSLTALDEAMLLAFSDHVVQRTPFTSVAEVLLAGLPKIVARGGTAINDHLYLATTLLGARQGRRVVVLLSDGVDSHSVLGMAQVLDRLRRSQVQLHWIRLPRVYGAVVARTMLGFSSSWRNVAGHRTEMELLETAVRDTGGRVVVVADDAGIEPAFRSIMKDLRDQYVLGYYPETTRRGHGWHRIQLSTRRPKVSLAYRPGYLVD